MRLLLLSPPGAGKGTQGRRIAERFGLAHLPTGDLLRANVADETPIGKAAKEHMDRGDLVPDQLVIDMMLARILDPDADAGYILDGFPRTLAQAEAGYTWAVERGLTLQAAIYLDVPEDEIFDRLLKRAHIEGRDDDNEETIRHRIDVFHEQTRPLADYYTGRGILVRVDALGEVDEVTDRIIAALEPFRDSE